jgi:hypothetical protein
MGIETRLVGSRKPFTTQVVARGMLGTSSLSGNVTLTRQSAQMLLLNPNGASRNVTLPAVEDGLSFAIKHTGTSPAETLVVKNPAGTTLATLVMGQVAEFWSDASAWAATAVLSTVTSDTSLLTATGTIATAAVKTLHATPVSLVVAPGAASFIDVIDCHWFLDFGTAAYDAAASGDTLGAKYTNAAGAQTLQTIAGNTIGAASADYHVIAARASTVLPVANAAVVANLDGTEWFAAAGDSPLKYELHYRVRTMDFV